MIQKLPIETARVFEPLLSPSRYKVAHGGRGSGKSHFCAGELVESAVLKPGLRAVCIREVQRSLAQSSKRLIEDKIQEFGLGRAFNVREADIQTPGDGLIIFQGMQNHTSESIKSLEGYSRAWVEEAQSLSQRSLDLLRPTIRAPGSELWFSYNPCLDTDPVDVLFRGGDPPTGSVVVEANWNDNPWFPEELRAEKDFDYRRDHDKAEWVWGGQYQMASEARIFRNYRVADLGEPQGVVWFYGVDWGFSVDPLAGVRCCFVDEQTLYISHEVNQVGVPTERVPGVLLAGLPDLVRWPSTGDSARPDTIDYVRRHGVIRLAPAIKGMGSVEDGITFLQGLDIVIHPRCTATLNEFNRYSYKRDKQTEEILPVVEDAWNHNVDALRYALERAHRKGKLVPGIVNKPKWPGDYGLTEPEDEGGWKTA